MLRLLVPDVVWLVLILRCGHGGDRRFVLFDDRAARAGVIVLARNRVVLGLRRRRQLTSENQSGRHDRHGSAHDRLLGLPPC
jgi:hypothetical protein